MNKNKEAKVITKTNKMNKAIKIIAILLSIVFIVGIIYGIVRFVNYQSYQNRLRDSIKYGFSIDSKDAKYYKIYDIKDHKANPYSPTFHITNDLNQNYDVQVIKGRLDKVNAVITLKITNKSNEKAKVAETLQMEGLQWNHDYNKIVKVQLDYSDYLYIPNEAAYCKPGKNYNKESCQRYKFQLNNALELNKMVEPLDPNESITVDIRYRIHSYSPIKFTMKDNKQSHSFWFGNYKDYNDKNPYKKI